MKQGTGWRKTNMRTSWKLAFMFAFHCRVLGVSLYTAAIKIQLNMYCLPWSMLPATNYSSNLLHWLHLLTSTAGPPLAPPPPKKSTSQRCSSRNMLQCSFLYFVVYIDCIGYLLADTWNPLPITRLTLMVSLVCCITCKKQKPQQYIYSAK